jgi:DNA-binding transcriptional LysR family regulator
MDWNDLRYVLALSRTSSLVAAARALGVEHTTVGRRIAAIERDLGVRLFSKTPEGHVPTAAGVRAIATAEAVERATQDLEAAIAGVDGKLEGVVRVTTSEGFLPIVVPHLARLYADHPAIRVELLSGNRLFDLTRGEADIAVRLVATTQPELIARKVCDVGWALFATAGYLAAAPVASPPSLRGHRVVGFDESLARTPGGAWLGEHADGAEVVYRGNSTPSVVAAAASGLGISCLPCLAGDRDPRLVRASDVVVSGGLWLVVHPDRQASARVQVVWDFLLDLMARERAVITGRPCG